VASPELEALLHDRLVFVTGKGGTGKTTFSAALARCMAARGRRTVLCEVDAQRPALKPIFGLEPGFEPVKVLPGLDVCNLAWPDVLGAYLRRMVRLGWVVDGILGNELIRRFLDFVPGAQDLVEVSAIDDLCQRYDCVVVDMPASGHAFSLLDITRSALRLFRAGPVRQRAHELRARISDPTTTVVLVALPEEMVVNETLETLQRLKDAQLVGGAPVIVLNRATPDEMAAEEGLLLERLQGGTPGADALLAAGRWRLQAEEAARVALERVTAATGQAPISIAPQRDAVTPGAAARAMAARLAALAGIAPGTVTWT
jgi:anion-transporting  ArsA/GET3 family ATPase